MLSCAAGTPGPSRVHRDRLEDDRRRWVHDPFDSPAYRQGSLMVFDLGCESNVLSERSESKDCAL